MLLIDEGRMSKSEGVSSAPLVRTSWGKVKAGHLSNRVTQELRAISTV